jgi:glycosyltransferase involved in cell wall biosynthesis
MNIVVVSNFYPPHTIGGYELGCYDVVEALKRRGHRVRVLTSVHGLGRASSDGDVHRRFSIDLTAQPRSSLAYGLSLLVAEMRSGRAFLRLVGESRPDVVYLWNLRYLPLSIARLAQRLGLAVCYFVSDDWLARWKTVDRWEQWTAHLPTHPLKRTLKRLLRHAGVRPRPAGRPEALDLRHVQFASGHLKQVCLESGEAVRGSTVVHWGVDTNRFAYRNEDRRDAFARRPRLLYAGQVVPSKGVDTAIEACRLLVHIHGIPGVALTIAGGSVRPDYVERLQATVRQAGLADHVRFTGRLAREQMPALYRAHDVLVFPSVWAEPFSITVLEAMASGLAVVGTATGGSGEILQHGVNALVFPPEDSAACARHVQALVDHPDVYEQIRRQGRQTVERGFDLEHMVDAIERDLRAAADEAARRASRGSPTRQGDSA